MKKGLINGNNMNRRAFLKTPFNVEQYNDI